jgi:hypothetical protein
MQCFSFLPSYTRIEFLTLSRFGMSDSEHSSLSNMLLQADSNTRDRLTKIMSQDTLITQSIKSEVDPIPWTLFLET